MPGRPAGRRGRPLLRSACASGQPQPQPQKDRPARALQRLLAGAGAAAASLLGPLLPGRASEFDYMAVPGDIDPSLAEAPELLDTLLVVVVTYFTVMLLFVWLSSFMDGEADGAAPGGGDASSSSGGAQGDQSEVPPGYGQFLDAHVRSYVNPDSAKITALQDLGQSQPLEGEDLEGLKGRLAAGAAEALEQQLRDCERLVRSKLLARRLGYHPAAGRAPGGAPPHALGQPSPHDAIGIGSLMEAAVFTAPEGLGSWQQRAAVEALVEQTLDELLPAGGGQFHEELVVRQAMRRLVALLVQEEALLLLESTQQGKRALEASGRAPRGPGSRWWALW